LYGIHGNRNRRWSPAPESRHPFETTGVCPRLR
jgi:hypothetical protein